MDRNRDDECAIFVFFFSFFSNSGFRLTAVEIYIEPLQIFIAMFCALFVFNPVKPVFFSY